jgi:hypothetical protein
MTAATDFATAQAAAWAAHRGRIVAAQAVFDASFGTAKATYGNVAANYAAFETAVETAQAIFDAAKADSEVIRSAAVTVARDTAIAAGELSI